MDPHYSLQDVIRCTLCEAPTPSLYCEICHINLCQVCAGEHLLDESKLHIVVPFKHRQSIPKCSLTPECPEHTTKLCELGCLQCDTPICEQCVSSQIHNSHDVVDILKYLKGKNKALQEDFEELGKFIYPKYIKFASSFPVQKTDLQKSTEKLLAALNKRGEDWHRQIDYIINRLKSDIKNTESKSLAVLKKQEDETNRTLLEIKDIICELKKLLDSNDACLFSKYKSRNAEFRTLPTKPRIFLPSFSYEEIDTEKLFKQFGSLSTPFTGNRVFSPTKKRSMNLLSLGQISDSEFDVFEPKPYFIKEDAFFKARETQPTDETAIF